MSNIEVHEFNIKSSHKPEKDESDFKIKTKLESTDTERQRNNDQNISRDYAKELEFRNSIDHNLEMRKKKLNETHNGQSSKNQNIAKMVSVL